MRDIIRQVVNVLATIAVIAVNGLASASGINGQLTGEISDRFDVYFVPAGYVFSIWGLIYLALIGFAVYQALPSQRENPGLRRIGYLYTLSCLANIAWLILWHYEYFELTLVAMFVLLLSLVAIYLRLNIGRIRGPAADRWLVHLPFSIYLGWITVATIANVTSVLFYLNWTGWGITPEVWAIVMLLVGTVLASAVCLTRGDVAYGLVIVWAFAGIAMKHGGTAVAIAAWVLAVAVLLAAVVGLLRRERLLPPLEPSTF